MKLPKNENELITFIIGKSGTGKNYFKKGKKKKCKHIKKDTD